MDAGLTYYPLLLNTNVQAAGNGYQPPEYAVDGDRVFLRGCVKVLSLRQDHAIALLLPAF
jgi:hypothetical protein